MQGEAHRSETGTWVRYQAGNEPLLAHLESEDSPRVTIAWRGGVPLERLQDLFFHACPKVVSASWRASATADSDVAFKAFGPAELPLTRWPEDVPGKPQFLRDLRADLAVPDLGYA